jgi:hypothetical protein
MQRTMSRLPTIMAAVGILTAMVGVHVRAQQQAPAGRVTTRPAAEVLAQIGQSAGVVVLADSTVQARLPMPAAPATATTVEQQITEMVRALPAGTTWVKLYAPTPANGRWSGEVVADYARAQARLLGTVSRAAPSGTVELFGRYVPTDKASEYIAALNLKLVYLVTNPRVPSGASVAASWAQMTPDQRQVYAQQQAQRMLTMDPATRLQMLRQMMENQDVTPQQMIMKMVTSQMTDDERVALKQSFVRDKQGASGGK